MRSGPTANERHVGRLGQTCINQANEKLNTEMHSHANFLATDQEFPLFILLCLLVCSSDPNASGRATHGFEGARRLRIQSAIAVSWRISMCGPAERNTSCGRPSVENRMRGSVRRAHWSDGSPLSLRHVSAPTAVDRRRLVSRFVHFYCIITGEPRRRSPNGLRKRNAAMKMPSFLEIGI